jgi:hypothetical protein
MTMLTPETYWFRCPTCGQSGAIDSDQANGLVSMVCPGSSWPRPKGVCDFHETGEVRPLIPTTTATRREDMPTWKAA